MTPAERARAYRVRRKLSARRASLPDLPQLSDQVLLDVLAAYVREQRSDFVRAALEEIARRHCIDA